jgi:hypothetical protein
MAVSPDFVSRMPGIPEVANPGRDKPSIPRGDPRLISSLWSSRLRPPRGHHRIPADLEEGSAIDFALVSPRTSHTTPPATTKVYLALLAAIRRARKSIALQEAIQGKIGATGSTAHIAARTSPAKTLRNQVHGAASKSGASDLVSITPSPPRGVHAASA